MPLQRTIITLPKYRMVPAGFSSSVAIAFRDVLRDGGSGVDAAIAVLKCIGVVNFQLSGIGGGYYMMIHDM